jgi:hypothetical protein
MQSVPITNNVVSSNPVHGEMYSIQHYVMKQKSWRLDSQIKCDIFIISYMVMDFQVIYLCENNQFKLVRISVKIMNFFQLMELYKIEKEDRLLFSEESSLNLTPEFRSKVLYKNYICETYVITIYAYFKKNFC